MPEWGLVELQGNLESRSNTRMENKFVGDLHIQKNGTPVLIIGHHVIHGKVQTLDKPLAVMQKVLSNPNVDPSTIASSSKADLNLNRSQSSSVEYEILAVIRRKMIFKARPKPIVVTHGKSMYAYE
ncbi:chromosome transmission fidelity protein 8 homolog [Diaphorina citri]|uniref:Chromosome transmission fidelity protein 8 homolog n=1 Tax=Diaphorina citri TaxID=121845 RepID=A0A1S4EL75_DIACI|nr:chromosome transmission fidelity protein 8 homolog [Diaphorina citri]